MQSKRARSLGPVVLVEEKTRKVLVYSTRSRKKGSLSGGGGCDGGDGGSCLGGGETFSSCNKKHIWVWTRPTFWICEQSVAWDRWPSLHGWRMSWSCLPHSFSCRTGSFLGTAASSPCSSFAPHNTHYDQFEIWVDSRPPSTPPPRMMGRRDGKIMREGSRVRF